MEKEKIKIGKVLTFAGAVIAFTIGSGFATGQEILQYFTAYGYKCILVVAVFLVIFLYTNYHFAKAGNEEQFERGSQIFSYFCGKKLGTVFDYFAVIFCYLSFIVMVAGASATLNQQYGIPPAVGGAILMVAAGITVVGGLNAMVDVLGKVGPLIVVLCIAVGAITLFRDMGNIPEGIRLMESGEVKVMAASSNWLFSGCSYGGFCLLWFAGFMTELGKKSKLKELTTGMFLGTAVIAVAILLVGFGLIANISSVYGAQIPNLILTTKILPAFSSFFAIVILMGIYTTAVPLLWTASSRFTKENSPAFKILTIVLAIVGFIVSLTVPFDRLVNIIYVLNGYVGALLILFMIIKNIRLAIEKRKTR
ncbi:MAG: alanine:cation symporter family protein [Lachnospiraceae bacterium]